MARRFIKLDKFYGGIAEDIYSGNAAEFSVAKNFDNYSLRGRLAAYRGVTSDVTGQNEVGNILLASDSAVYGLGTVVATTRAKIFCKTSIGAVWVGATNGEDALTGVSTRMFFENEGYLYYWRSAATGDIRRWKIDGTLAIASIGTVGVVTNFGPGLAAQNKIAYFAYDNKIASWEESSGNFNANAFDVPTEYVIESLDEWNFYLVVGCRNKANPELSQVFFWDTISDSFTYSKPLREPLKILRNVGGELIAVCNNNTPFASPIDAKLFIYTYNGGDFILRKKLIRKNNFVGFNISDTAATTKDSQLYFGVITSGEKGIFRFGINSGVYCLVNDRGATSDNSEIDYRSVTFAGDFMFVVHTAPGTITRTDDSSSSFATGNYETLYFNGPVKASEQQLVSIAISTIALPVGASAVVRYRKDSETAFTTIGTHSGTNTVFSRFNILASGATLPSFHTIQFQVETNARFVQITELTAVIEDRFKDYY